MSFGEQSGEQVESLQEELREQRAALAAVLEMAEQSPGDMEILQMQNELENLVHQIELQIRHGHPCALDTASGSQLQIGQLYSFRHTDGCWHLGQLQSINDDGAVMNFLRPSKAHMLHNVEVSLSLLQPHQLRQEKRYEIGQRVLAYNRNTSLWETAELCEQLGSNWSLIFVASGSRAVLDPVHIDHVSLGLPNSEEDDDLHSRDGNSELTSDEEHGSDDEASGAEKDVSHRTARLAAWEHHTRGIGSKMMLDMGYRIGRPLGTKKTGITQPLQVDRFKPGAGLGAEGGALGPTEHSSRQKRRRGGRKARQRRGAKEAYIEREKVRQEDLRQELDTGDSGVFALVNGHLGDRSETAKRLKTSASRDGFHLHQNRQQYFAGKQSNGSKKPANESRKSLVNGQDSIAAAQAKVTRLKEMAVRNAKDLIIAKQVSHKLVLAEKELQLLRANQAHSLSAVQAKEKQKSWLKF